MITTILVLLHSKNFGRYRYEKFFDIDITSYHEVSLFLHDYTLSLTHTHTHTHTHTQPTLQKCYIKSSAGMFWTIDHTPSRDLVQSDYFLFQYLKHWLGRKPFF